MAKNKPQPTISVVNVGYRSTNYWVIGAGTTRLLVDLGYPGTMGIMQANLKRMDIPISQIRYALATHYHIDHAGLAQELKQAGVTLLVMESQREAIPMMKRWTKPADHYLDISLHDNKLLHFHESRALLAQIGIAGEIVPTLGHSDHCVSLVLDTGEAFTGDLTPLVRLSGEDDPTARDSWQRLHAMGARLVYPGHGPIHALEL
jgi:endoribonuclease LACTB2